MTEYPALMCYFEFSLFTCQQFPVVSLAFKFYRSVFPKLLYVPSNDEDVVDKPVYYLCHCARCVKDAIILCTGRNNLPSWRPRDLRN